MKFFGDIFRGIGHCFKGFSLLFERGLWPYMFYPLLVWILMWVASMYGLILLAEGMSDWLKNYFSFESIPAEGHWLSWARPFLVSKVGFVVTWVLKILFWFLSGTFIKYIMLIVMSPVFALLSEKTEEKLTGNNYPFTFVQLMKDIGRGIVISLRNMILEYFFIFVLTLISFFFPPLFFITTPFLFFLGWYFVGFALLDYNCERHKFGVGEGIQFIKRNKGYAIGVGFVYSFFLALPTVAGSVIGMMFGPALGVIGATLSFLEVRKLSQSTSAK